MTFDVATPDNLQLFIHSFPAVVVGILREQYLRGDALRVLKISQNFYGLTPQLPA